MEFLNIADPNDVHYIPKCQEGPEKTPPDPMGRLSLDSRPPDKDLDY